MTLLILEEQQNSSPPVYSTKLSHKYDYPLLVVPALMGFFKYEISIHRMYNHLSKVIQYPSFPEYFKQIK